GGGVAAVRGGGPAGAPVPVRGRHRGADRAGAVVPGRRGRLTRRPRGGAGPRRAAVVRAAGQGVVTAGQRPGPAQRNRRGPKDAGKRAEATARAVAALAMPRTAPAATSPG